MIKIILNSDINHMKFLINTLVLYMRNTVKDKNMHSKDILLSKIYYNLIVLSENKIRLFEGREMQVTEIQNEFLLYLRENNFQNQIAGFKKAEKKIRASIHNKNAPVIICGESKILNAFKEISQTHYSLPYYFELNFDNSSLSEIGTFAGSMAKQIYHSK